MNTPQVERTSRYVVVVDGRVSGRISGAFPHVRCRAYGSRTVLVCGGSAQSDVYDVLRALGGLGVDVNTVRRIPERR